MPADHRLERQAAVRASLAAEGVEALLVTHLPNIRYLTGFTGSAALLLIRPEDTVLLTDFRYATQAPAEVAGTADVAIDAASVWDRLKRLWADRPAHTLGSKPTR